MLNFKPGAWLGALVLCGGLGIAYLFADALPAPASVLIPNCTTPPTFLHGASQIGQACGGPSILSQTTGISTVSNTTVAATAFSVTTGNALAVFVDYHAATTTVSVADTAVNTFTAGAACDQNGNSHGTWFWAANVTGNASDVVTATFGLARGHKEITVYQFSGASTSAPKDFNGACALQSSADMTPTSGSFTTTVANEILLIGVSGAANSQTFTAGTGYTLGMAVGGVASGRTEFKQVSSIQTGVTAFMTFGLNSTWAVTVLTIK